MIITMIPMGMMQMAVDQVVNVITVGNGLMCTAGTVYMSLVMSTAVMIGRTSVGICRVDFKHVVVDVIEVHMMQVTIMQIVGMAGMSDSDMAAGGFVLMVVSLMLGAGAHRDDPPTKDATEPTILR